MTDECLGFFEGSTGNVPRWNDDDLTVVCQKKKYSENELAIDEQEDDGTRYCVLRYSLQ